MVPDELREKRTTCAIYSSQQNRDDVDIFFNYCALPRIFE
jgi:hypothetical protein